MASERHKVEIGFEGGQVVSARLTEDALKDLRSALDSDRRWLDVETDDETLALDLESVVFLRISATKAHVGF